MSLFFGCYRDYRTSVSIKIITTIEKMFPNSDLFFTRVIVLTMNKVQEYFIIQSQ